MSSPQPPGAYDLPEAQREEIFQRFIVPEVLLANDPEPQDQPALVVLGGQPGAGKSSAAHLYEREFATQGRLVWVTWDDFRPYHPAYEPHRRQHGHRRSRSPARDQPILPTGPEHGPGIG